MDEREIRGRLRGIAAEMNAALGGRRSDDYRFVIWVGWLVAFCIGVAATAFITERADRNLSESD